MSARVRDALELLRSEKCDLESRIAGCFDVALSRRLDSLIAAIEALETLDTRDERAA